MALTLGKPYLVLRTGMKDGKQAVLVMDGDCDEGLTLGKPRLSLRTGTKDGKQVQLVADQKLDPDGKLILNKPYLALRSGMKDGKVVVVVPGMACEAPANPTVCGCEICCTLDATVSVNDGSDEWTEPFDVELTCGGVIEFQAGYCCLNDEVEDDTFCFKYTNTFAEKDTFGSPEAYNWITTSGTIEINTKIWASDDFVINGDTYRLSYWRTERAIHQTAPTTAELSDCYEGWLLQRLANDPVTYGDYWDIVESYWNGGSNVYGYWTAATVSTPSIFTVTNDNPYAPEDCPEGFSYSGGDLQTGYGCATYQSAPPYGGRADNAFSRCPVSLWSETWSSTVITPTCDQRIPCARIGIFDRCTDRLSCDLETALSGASELRLDWEVTGCHANSGSNLWTGAACSEFWMFNAGTALVGGGTTAFDDEDPSGAGSEFAAFCDSEEVFWHQSGDYASGSISSRIEAALACYTPETGDPYIAAYALLTQNCYDPFGDLCAVKTWSYKTRDLAITFIDSEIVVSFTGLTPFYSETTDDCGTTDCSCADPGLSLAWRFKVSEC